MRTIGSEEIYLHGIQNIHLPQVHTLELYFKTQYLFSIITSPAFHPNLCVQLVPFSSYTLADQSPHLISVSLSTLLFLFQPVWVQRRRESQERQVCITSDHAADQAVGNGHHKVLLAPTPQPEPGTGGAKSVLHGKLWRLQYTTEIFIAKF